MVDARLRRGIIYYDVDKNQMGSLRSHSGSLRFSLKNPKSQSLTRARIGIASDRKIRTNQGCVRHT